MHKTNKIIFFYILFSLFSIYNSIFGDQRIVYCNIITQLNVKITVAVDIEEVLQYLQREVRSRSINSNEQEEKLAM